MTTAPPQPGPAAAAAAAAAVHLADYLESATFAPPPPPPPPPSPTTILTAWSRLRDPSTSPADALAALETLHHHRRALLLSSAHASLLLPLLPLHPRLVAPLLAAAPHLVPASVTASLPFALRLLLLGARASVKDLPSHASFGKPASTAKSPGSGESTNGHDDDPVVAVSRVLEDVERGEQSIDDLDHLALTGVGYALASADEMQFRRILVSLLRICGRTGNLDTGVRVLKLMEWLVMGFVESRKMRKVQVLFELISPEKCEGEDYVLFPVVMTACGGLRALRVASARYRLDFDPRLKQVPERTIQFAAERAVLEGRPADDQRILVQCVALGLTRCGQVAFHESVLQCVCMGLLKELLPLPDLLRMSVENAEGNSAEFVKAQVNQHLGSVLFKEAGPVTGVLCNQYSYANDKAKSFVETCVWEYAQEIYCHLRAAVLLHWGKQDDLITAIDKIAEASFLMVVVFAAEVTEHRLNAKSSEGFQPEVAARILVAFSCVEHLRRLRLPEYTEAVRSAVLAIQENAAATALFIESMPSYTELTSKPDDPRLKQVPERTIQFAAERAVLEGRPADDQRILAQCVALGLTRCGQVAFHESVLQCVCMGLLKELLPLPDLLRMSVENAEGNSAEFVKARVNQHLGSVLFKEAGPVTGVLCNQYSYANDKAKSFVETCVWEYAQEIYCHLRAAVLLHWGKQDDLITAIDKIAEASFLMVVVFAAEVTEHRLNAKSSEGFQPEVAARILVAFSCVEHLRRLRLPEYTEAVRSAVLAIQENAAATALFIESMPSYTELTSKPDLPALAGTTYIWHRDEVQTSRILFYLRVVPTCVGLIPVHMIQDKVASIMFLYLQHSNEKVTSASHSVMVSFSSSGSDTDQDDRAALKEQLTFYYIKRSLEAYPGVTPFDGLASGVAALVRHLPAGSAAILFCIHSLVVKAKDLCEVAKVQNKSLWRSWEESTDPCKKMLDLLLRLIFLVDIQSFPYLLKELAEFVTLLPKEGQDALLDDMHAHVAESDDVTRKPVLVSWLQFLSYLSSQSRSESHSKAKSAAASVASDEMALNRAMARL